MSNEQEELAANINAGIETASGCAGCYVGLLLIFASPMIVVTVWGLIGSATNSDAAALVGAAIAAVGLIVVIARLAGGRR
ncbi:MAG: hypothetical protein WCP21_19770 [Armatimonadota bacterium]